MATEYEIAAQWANRIEEALRDAGMWQGTPLPDEAYDFKQAFAMDTMAFSQWLQFIFLGRIRSIIAEGGTFPTRSEVAAQAVREFDTVPQASDVLSALSGFDDWINRGRPV
ncbi:MAG: YqcC family protein [Bryobacteraceae bacterium]